MFKVTRLYLLQVRVRVCVCRSVCLSQHWSCQSAGLPLRCPAASLCIWNNGSSCGTT